jgi:signal transduction histidine kinase/streptogramin lyase
MLVILVASLGVGATAATGTIVHGRVMDALGLPATNTWVQVQTLDPGAPEFARTGGWALGSTTTGTNGEFAVAVKVLPDSWALLALQGADAAWYEHLAATSARVPSPLTLELRPWPRINGSILALDGASMGSAAIELETSATYATPTLAAAAPGVAVGDGLKPGLVAEVFVIPDAWQPFNPDWFSTTPLLRRIDAQIEYPYSVSRFRDAGVEDFFAVRWSGLLRVPRDGEYRLTAKSDDGVRVVLDDHEVLYRSWPRGTSSTNQVWLTAGDHELRVEFFELGSGHACELSWTPPGGAASPIPASAFFHAGRHATLQATRSQPRPTRSYTDANGGFSLKFIPGVRYERLRHLGLEGPTELARAESLRLGFNLQSAPPVFKMAPIDKGRWRVYTTADGLPADDVRRILFARDGAAWFATGRGAARFDGRQFRTLSRLDGLVDDSVFALCQTADDAIWLGGATGVSRLRRGQLQTYTSADGLTGGEVFHIEAGTDGRVWFRTREGLSVLDGDRFHTVPGVSRFPSVMNIKAKPLAVGTDGTVWVVTKERGELSRWDGAQMRPVATTIIHTNDWIDALHLDRQGRLWFQIGDRGLGRIEGDHAELVVDARRVQSNGFWATSFLEQEDGSYWFGTEGNGILRSHGRSHLRFGAPHPLPSETVADIKESPDGAVWVASLGGVACYESAPLATFTRADGLPANPAFGLAFDRSGRLWAGCNDFSVGGGVWQYDGTRAAVLDRSSGIEGTGVLHIFRASDDAMWLSEHSAGVVRYRGGKRSAFGVQQGLGGANVYIQFTEAPDGSLWLACESFLSHFDVRREQDGPDAFRNFSVAEIHGPTPAPAGTRIRAVEVDPGGTVWVGTSQSGLFQFDGRGFSRPGWLGTETNLTINWITRDRDGWMWLSTRQQGAIGMRGDRLVRHRAAYGGLASDGVNHVMRDSQGVLWFGTDDGVSRFDGTNWITLTRRHGLPHNVVHQIAEAPTGEIWFSTEGGLARYRRPARTPSKPVLFRRTAKGRELLAGADRGVETLSAAIAVSDNEPQIEVGAPQTIEWEAADFTTPGEQRVFRVLLQPDRVDVHAPASQLGWTHRIGRQDLEWAPSARGAWTLAVEFVDRDGNVSAPAVAMFNVFLPWYRNAAVLYPGGAGIAGLAAVALISTRRARRRQREANRLRELMLEQEQRARVTLEAEVQERRRAETAAKEASAAKSQFLASMSHELRTPLNAIIGYSEMLEEEAPEIGAASMIPDLQKVQAAAKHQLGLINDILDLSKIEAGKMTLFVEQFDVARLVHEVEATALPLVAKKSNRLEVDCPADIGFMRADQTKVRQVLFNLISNAAKFTEKGVITLTVCRRRGDEALTSGPAPSRSALGPSTGQQRLLTSSSTILFRVTDTGIGMTPEQLTRLFQAFTQAEASTSIKYGGTGLGLALSRRFCRLMGGDLTVVSEFGRGSTFTASLPCSVTLEPEASAGESGSR